MGWSHGHHVYVWIYPQLLDQSTPKVQKKKISWCLMAMMRSWQNEQEYFKLYRIKTATGVVDLLKQYSTEIKRTCNVKVDKVKSNLAKLWTASNILNTELTWKMATASDSRASVTSEESVFLLRSLHLTSSLQPLSEALSSCFFIKFREESGSFSSPRITNFCKAEWILSHPVQQNHFPFGNSCCTNQVSIFLINTWFLVW